ncbi:hypothetical protein BOQ04_07130 [Polynucleobacter sphagniphilus]|nr:hypothetical protein BOQ04_07130 [Polynucleobacter sphagniphilus]
MTPSNPAYHKGNGCALGQNEILRRSYIALILIAIISLSVAQGAYTLDPHHWGLMLSNAKDFWGGKLPYKDIFIQYGFLTTLVQAVGFGIGKNLLSLIVLTSIFYAVGIWGVYLISVKVLASKVAPLYVITGLFLFHPLAIYPWSNYIAFPFLVLGLYALIVPNSSPLKFLLGGISFGLAVLSREGLAPAIVLLILLSFIYDLNVTGREARQDSLVLYGSMLAGLVLPLGIFFAYLYQHHLISYWVLLSIDLPKIYAQESFQYIGNGFILSAVFQAVIHGWRHGEIRWIFISIIWGLNLAVFIVSLFQIRVKNTNAILAKLSLATLLLISGSLHLAEIFRIATASSVGIVTLYALLEKYKRVAFYFFVISSLWMTLTLGQNRWTGTNYFLPSSMVINQAVLVQDPNIFQGSRWNFEVIEYYQFVQFTLAKLHTDPSCKLLYQKNETRDSFFAVLTPFSQLQISPYENGQTVNQLRPDLDFESEIQRAASIVILTMVPRIQFGNFKAPAGFAIYAHHAVPEEWQMPENQELLILTPQSCSGIQNVKRVIPPQVN